MALEPLSKSEINRALGSEKPHMLSSEDTPNFIIRTSGETMYGSSLIPFDEMNGSVGTTPSPSHIFNMDEIDFNKHDYVVVKQGVNYIAVPYSDIAGLTSIQFSQKKAESDSPPTGSSVIDTLWNNSREIAKKSGYPTGYEPVSPCMGAPSDFSWDDVTFSDDTPLYCDWGYLERRSGGINSLGGGAFGVSISAGWDESLWSEFKNAVETSRTKLNKIGQHSEIATSGFIDFLKVDEEYISREMDGKEWIAGIISDEQINEVSETEYVTWSIGFFKKESLMFPLKSWECINNPITIYGEIIDSQIDTGFGRVDYFLKARAGAYLHNR